MEESEFEQDELTEVTAEDDPQILERLKALGYIE